MSTGARVERKPALTVAFTVLFFAWLYLPILAVVIFSFNDIKSLSTFNGFSLRWYSRLLPRQRPDHLAVRQPRHRRGLGRRVARPRHDAGARPRADHARGPGAPSGRSRCLPLVTPEIVTGVAALLFFHGLGMKLSLVTVTLAEITFSIAYVTVIVRGRLASMSPEVEEAARDLGCTPCAGRAAGHPADPDPGAPRRRRCWSSRWSSTTSCSRSSPPASIHSRCRCGSTPRSASASPLPSTRSARCMLAVLRRTDRAGSGRAAAAAPRVLQPGPDHRRRFDDDRCPCLGPLVGPFLGAGRQPARADQDVRHRDGRRPPRPRHRARRVLLPARPVGLRQDHDPAHDRRASATPPTAASRSAART